MNNLHRELAPISAAAWASIEEEATRTFTLHVAARKAVDVTGPDGLGAGRRRHRSRGPDRLAGRRGHGGAARLAAGGGAHASRSRSTAREIDSVERGAQDPDWQPVKDAAKQIAFAEDRAVFDGYAAAQITGIRQASSNPGLTLPGET